MNRRDYLKLIGGPALVACLPWVTRQRVVADELRRLDPDSLVLYAGWVLRAGDLDDHQIGQAIPLVKP